MDTTESSNDAERRSTTPQPQQTQAQQPHDLHVTTAPPRRPISDISDPIRHKIVQSSTVESQSRRERGYKGHTPLPSLNPPRTPSPQTLPSQSTPNRDGTFTNFQLPNDILKNLTPIIKSPPKDKTKQHIRKQAYMRNVQLKVSARNNRVEKQSKDWKRQQQEFIQYQSAKLTELLQRAKIRRDEYLQMVREKAVRFVKTEEGGLSGGEKQSALSPQFSQTSSSESQVWLVEQDLNVRERLVYFQRLSKRRLFKKHTMFLQSSTFLNRYDSMPFNKVLTCFNTDSSIKMSISYVLNYLGITTNTFELKMFLYCFIMIADFNDCMINGPHPGFNYNLEIKTKDQEKATTAQNCIWVILYKLTTCLLEEFKQVVHIAPKILPRFWKYWNDYKFIFKIFKWNHFVGINRLLNNSISIVEEQITRISDDQDLYHQRIKLNMELSLLNKYNLLALKQFNESQQVTQLISLVSDTIEELFTSFGANSPSFIQNQSNFICFDLLKFHIPDFISFEKWRLYWMNLYFREFDLDRMYPSVLKTGYLGEVRPKTSNVDYIDLVDSLMDLELFSLNQTYEILYDYYLEFSGVYSLPGIVDGADGLQRVQNLIKHYDKKNKLIQFTKPNLDDEEILQLKYSVVIMWLQKCQFNMFQDFINFENLYTIVNLKNFKNLRYSIYTQNPNLLFPEFYKLVMKFHSLDVETQLRSIIYASFKNNLNRLFRIKPSFNQEAFQLFNQVFNHMIVNGEFENELSVTFKDNFRQYHTKLQALVKTNSISMMYHSYTGIHLPTKCLQEAVGNLHLFPNKQFVAYYENHGDKICSLLFDKWQNILRKVADGHINLSNIGSHLQLIFTECTQDMELLSLEICKFNRFVYKMYMPILNWVYGDLGPGGGPSGGHL